MANKNSWEMMGAISRWLLASVLFLLIMLGWLGDSLLSVVMRRPMLSFQEVYASWKNHLRRSRAYHQLTGAGRPVE
jgi:hypothetical protein